jgi:hypothetical protein
MMGKGGIMADIGEPSTNGRHDAASVTSLPASDSDPLAISARMFEEQFDENIRQTLDVERWRLGHDLNQEYQRLEREVREAEEIETVKEKQIRNEVFPWLASLPNMPKNAGKHETTPEDLAAVHRGLLFNGGVEACDGAIQTHKTLPLTVYQIGVSLVSYRGDQGTWGQRLFRRDLRQKGLEVEEIMDFLERRARRDASAREPGQDQTNEFVQKAFLSYAERAILLRRSQAAWRLGHGDPVTYELLTGGGNLELMVEATRVLRELVEVKQRFVFLAGEPREALLATIGQALHPGEYAIVGTLSERLDSWVQQKRFRIGVSSKLHWDDELISPTEWIPRVIDRVASKIVIGLFRPTLLAPAQTFYAHEDHSDIAGHIALADCMLKEQGTSMLLEMANRVCDSVFGDSLEALTESAYAAVGAHDRFLSGRIHRAR